MDWTSMVEWMGGLLVSARESTGTELPGGAGLAGVAVLLVNLVNCFFGYRLFRFMVAVTGAMTGLAVGAVVGLALDNHGLALGLMALLAVALAVAAFRIYQIGVFLFCGAIPAALAYFLWGGLVALIVFVVMGVCGVIFSRPYLIAVSAIPSGLAAGSVAVAMAGVGGTVAAFALGAALAALGFAVQWKSTGKRPEGPAE